MIARAGNVPNCEKRKTVMDPTQISHSLGKQDDEIRSAVTRPSDALPPASQSSATPASQFTPDAIRDARAANLQTVTGAAYLYGALATLFPNFDTTVYQAYVDKQLEECGNPRDPIERMLIEQMLIAHHAIGRLCIQGTQSATPDASKIYHDAAARFMGEFRRCALAVREDRKSVV